MSENNFLGNNSFGLGKGITITTGFDVATQKPLDSRTVVYTLEELYALPEDRVYLGLLVHVVDENKLYQWKHNLNDDGNLSEEPSWGPIEAEVSTRDVNEIITLDAPIAQLQKNKNDFFPVVHERGIYVEHDDSLIDVKFPTLFDKYQTRYDSSLNTDNKTVSGSLNELNERMDDAIADFRDEIQAAIDELNGLIDELKAKNAEEFEKMREYFQAEIDRMLAELQNKSEEMDELFEDIRRQIAELQNKIRDDVNQMLQDVDNVILSDQQVANLMDRIIANLRALEEFENVGVPTNFCSYTSSVIVNDSISEVSLTSLGVTVSPGDILYVHFNSVYLTKNIDYRIDYVNQKIVTVTDEPWNKNKEPNCEFTFDLLKCVNDQGIPVAIISEDGGLLGFSSYNASIIVTTPVNEVSLSSLGVTVESDDALFVHKNSVYLTKDVDYRIDYTNQKIINKTNTPWNSSSLNCEFAFDLIKNA